MRRSLILGTPVALVVLLAACGSSAPTPVPTLPPTPVASTAPKPVVGPPDATPMAVPLTAPAGDGTTTTISTALGDIVIQLYNESAPVAARNFEGLAEAGFYDGTTFHRVEPGFVIQGGDPYSRDGGGPAGTGGPGYNLAAEFNTRPHEDGTLAMARAGSPDSAGSQFYICLGRQAFLDNNYTVFGQVVEGLDVVHSIERNDPMTSVTIEHRPQG